MPLTRHCWKCGTEYTLAGQPGRLESCPYCGSDLKVCLNCVSYDSRVAHQCRDRRADPVAEKHIANFWDSFDMIKRKNQPQDTGNSREQRARTVLKEMLAN